MNLSGEYLIAADRQTVWRGINDPDLLRRCIPGCEDIQLETPTDWVATVVTKVGPVKARFTGKIRLEDLDPPASLRLVGEGSGGPAGFAKGAAVVTLVEEEGKTRLSYSAESEIGGKLAQIGARLIDSFARKYADDFFAKFAVEVGAPPPEAVPAATVAAGRAAPVAKTARSTPVAAQGPQPAILGGERRFDPQTFTILVLASLLVFMTIMFALKT